MKNNNSQYFDNSKIYQEIENEIIGSTKKHGANLIVPSLDPILLDRNASRMAKEYEIPTADRAKYMTDLSTKRGQLTHAHIVIEELCEVVDCMKDEEKMRKELVQLACTVVKWINAIDWKNSQLEESNPKSNDKN